MKLKHYFAIILVFGIIFGLNSFLGAEEQKTKDGKTIFIDAKCGNCHSIAVEKIFTTKKPAGKVPPPDMSDVGLRFKADFLIKYLKKEEAINDKKHLVPFKGEEADILILATWLESLKTAPPAAAE